MFQPYRPSIRLSPRRHDVGAALMVKFRPKDGGPVRNRRLRGADILRALLLPIVCFTVAFVIKEQRGASWMKPSIVAAAAAPSVAVAGVAAVSRTAPDAPFERSAEVGVRLTHIEEQADQATFAVPVSLSREIRVLDDEPPQDSKTAEQPSLRAALNLGDQAVRSVHH